MLFPDFVEAAAPIAFPDFVEAADVIETLDSMSSSLSSSEESDQSSSGNTSSMISSMTASSKIRSVGVLALSLIVAMKSSAYMATCSLGKLQMISGTILASRVINRASDVPIIEPQCVQAVQITPSQNQSPLRTSCTPFSVWYDNSPLTTKNMRRCVGTSMSRKMTSPGWTDMKETAVWQILRMPAVLTSL